MRMNNMIQNLPNTHGKWLVIYLVAFSLDEQKYWTADVKSASTLHELHQFQREKIRFP